MTKMRQDTWETLPRTVKLAYVLYPSQAPEWAQREMRIRAANEQKVSPLDRGGSKTATVMKRR